MRRRWPEPESEGCFLFSEDLFDELESHHDSQFL